MDAPIPKPKLRASTWARLNRQSPPAGKSDSSAVSVSAETSSDDLPSIDAIITRTRPVVDRSFHRQQEELIEREAAVDAAEQALDSRRREIRELEIHLQEKERELLEWDRLVEVREQTLRKREQNLATNLSEASLLPSADTANEREELVRVRAALQRREEELRVLAERCARRSKELDQREAQLDRRVASAPQKAAPAPPSKNTLSDWELQLSQKEAMLKEREAFVEKSENVLFERAQELQILEAEIEQRLAGSGEGV
jgi:chromosome segregation ATPase